ncbi:L-threonylcarbamoyladenylate synthase [Psychroflexus tropicus]|uniref:L-threonylcarbamoyladenylate synthase n=1 Tax=Psychroflexus tropicus TaxID=197345 RepID=UPI000375F57C|nr:L-threonylcarbamoyladenylate synthase [Psychroflexus tropicus]
MITKDIEPAVQVLNKNDLVAIPTETVYGLAGNALSEIAVSKIFELKKRPLYNPLIVHIKSLEYLPQITRNIPSKAYKLAEDFWPGPLTLVLEKSPEISDLVTSGKSTLAVRVPNHPLSLALLKQLDYPLAAPSANPFGSISPTSAAHVDHYFHDNLQIILDGGDCQRGIESTIIGFKQDTPVVYRLGSLPLDDIQKSVGEVISLDTNAIINPQAPGMLSRHYAPKTDTFLTEDVRELASSFPGEKIGVLLFQHKITDFPVYSQEILSPSGDLNEAAKNLYAAMHRLDQLNLDRIIAEKLPEFGLGLTLNDKLTRATKKV